jgi:bis(5'-nucleosidyl)-tetraphosphatase
MTIHERSYGIVPLSKQENEWKIFLVQHEKAKYWGFPKGHAEQGEAPREAATRELLEETQLKIVRFLSEGSLEEHYHYTLRGQLISKTVCLFIAEVEGDPKLQEEEISDGRWFSLQDAVSALTYPTDKSVCREAIALVGL